MMCASLAGPMGGSRQLGPPGTDRSRTDYRELTIGESGTAFIQRDLLGASECGEARIPAGEQYGGRQPSSSLRRDRISGMLATRSPPISMIGVLEILCVFVWLLT